jgi:glycosyltransferase involved in cell wall biosynthesis
MPEKKKLALCLEYPLALRGGVSVLVECLIDGLKPHYDLVLVSPDTVEDLAATPAASAIVRHFQWDRQAVTRSASRQLAHQLAGEGVHLAHFHFGGNFGWGNRTWGKCPIPWLDELEVPACSTVHLVVHPLDGFCGPEKPWWFKLALFPLAWTAKMHVLAHLHLEIAVSQHDLRKLERWYWPMHSRFAQIYHSRLPAGPGPQTGAPRDPVILNVGHIAWRKGQLFLAEAFAQVAPRHPEWKLCLVGKVMEADIGEQIRALAQARGLQDRIQFPGERQDALDLMARAGIYVQPSYFEALGLALQEAMFVGCPAIGTRAGGIPELIEDQRTGLLVNPGQIDELAKALDSLMSNPQVRDTYGRKGAVSIVQKGMTAGRMVDRHLELYESILRDP